ncbi:unnamed protein product [Zymoseptoria tritici ST99CH_3D7]|uniref:glutathione-specific gamma-glutamylcyclotransferase n=1 Tax=Zymoseptoria tritici (strain ST99CH_3D7) TaxID=1276538 RepID=A0A1X7RS61_ZYMT9|nr:unnamed protein product [Zymoseptoria tritici ST99CH_3D7]
MSENGESDLWLFGYGSLIWKPPPHFDLRVPGYIEGYVRRFWQARFDRRVCTLIDRQLWETLTDQHASAPPRTWGAAYRIPSKHVPEVKEYLDIREINGYSIQYVPFHPQSSSNQPLTPNDSNSSLPPGEIKCLVYIGLPDNPQFLGPQDPQALAEHIVDSRGPSGENKDYLYQLDEALRGLSRDSGDEHVSDLARRCREVEARRGKGDER